MTDLHEVREDEQLREIGRELGSIPYLVGGAPRDVYLGKPVRDFDVFFFVGKGLAEVEKVMNDYFAIKLSNSEYKDSAIVVYRLCSYLKERPVDLIFCELPLLEYVSNFPCNLSKFWVNVVGNKGIRFNIDAAEDIENNTITFSSQASSEYMQKLIEKYPERTVKLRNNFRFNEAGKGDKYRPVDRDRFESNFEGIDFSAHRKQQEEKEKDEDTRPE